MSDIRTDFSMLPLHASQTVSWIHIGDTHLTHAGETNEIDLGRIVDEINQVYANSGIDFVYVPGDIADDGSARAYKLFRSHLDRLQLPWTGIVGDHDVHEESFANFRQYVAEDLYGSFSIGDYHFFRLNAFSAPRPDAFSVDKKQLLWLETGLRQCEAGGQKAILFLHCYPSDLKQGGRELAALLHRYPVLLVDMGHTHYNEISNDGDVLYTATRSTGQIEEGPVGYSVTTMDHGVSSWHFQELGSPSLVAITSPADRRLHTSRTPHQDTSSPLRVRAKVWSPRPVENVVARAAGCSIPLACEGGVVWSGTMQLPKTETGNLKLEVVATDASQASLSSSIEWKCDVSADQKRDAVDQQNAIGEWKERGILGTQLGPNKNGRKW